eukprot:8978966-Pyramimonas_sp.AAC.1
MGISVKALQRLWEQVLEAFPEDDPGEISTTMVVEKMVKPVRDTIFRLIPVKHVYHYSSLYYPSVRSRYTELEERMDPGEVGMPMYFISHAWKAPFKLLVDKVCAFLRSAGPDVRMWIDIVAVNQHPEAEHHKQNKEDIAAFEDVIQVCRAGTLVVVDLMYTNPATRGWCLFEWCACCDWSVDVGYSY